MSDRQTDKRRLSHNLAEVNMVQSLIGWFVVKSTGGLWWSTFRTSHWKLLLIQRCISEVSAAFFQAAYCHFFRCKILFLHLQEFASLSGPWGEHVCRTEQTCTHRLSSHTLLCRRKCWGVEIYSSWLLLRLGLTRSMPRIWVDQWVWQIYRAGGTPSWFFMMHRMLLCVFVLSHMCLDISRDF